MHTFSVDIWKDEFIEHAKEVLQALVEQDKKEAKTVERDMKIKHEK